MNVLITDEQTHLPISQDSLSKAVKFLVEKEQVDCDEISIHLIDDQKISRLHEFYFQDPSPTDCISFPIDEPGKRDDGVCFLGEIFISTQTANAYANAHQLSAYDEVLLYLVHGFLHLLGYDDITVEDRKKMREKEKNCIDMLSAASIYLEPLTS